MVNQAQGVNALVESDADDSETLGTRSSSSTFVGPYPKAPTMVLEKEEVKAQSPSSEKDAFARSRAALPTTGSFRKSTELHTRQFLEAMKAYQTSAKDPNIIAIDLSGKHSWDEVLRVAKDAEAEYRRSGRKVLRYVARTFTSKSVVVLPYLKLIPNGFFSSMLAGALKLVFTAAASISQTHDEVLKILFRIPEIITEAEHRLENFNPDQDLYDRAERLYVAVLTAVEGITKWLKRSPISKPLPALFLGPLYNRSFKEKAKDLDEALSALERRVSTLRDRTIVRTGETVETIKENLRITGVKIDGLSDIDQARKDARDALAMILEEKTRTADWMNQKDREVRRLSRQVKALQKAAVSLTRDDLIAIMMSNGGSATQDLDRMLRASESTELPMTSHIAKAIIEGRPFQDWLSKDAPAALFIEDGSSQVSSRMCNPLSLLGSILVDNLRNKEPAIALHFFCGLHTSRRKDSAPGPQGLMRSLLCQILQLFPVNLDFISSRRYRDQLESYDIRSLCDCFRKLVEQLPVDAVLICIVDGISFFERQEWSEACGIAIQDLRDLVYEDELGPVFKLLVTSPVRSRHIARLFPAHCRLLVSGDGDGGGGGVAAARGMPTERDISMANRRPRRARESELFRSLETTTHGMAQYTDGASDMPTDSDCTEDTGAESYSSKQGM